MGNTDLKMTRGDNFKITYQIETANDITISEAIFTIKKRTIDKIELIQKIFPASGAITKSPIAGTTLSTHTFEVNIIPEDTNNLSFGKYMYDLQIKYDNDLILTVIKPSIFEIMEEVTWGD